MADNGNICGLLNLTVKCNQNCIFCCDGDVKDSGYHLTFDEAREKVAAIAAQGADSITFIGGEPLVQKYLAELVAYARERGLRVGLTTNGTLLTEERLAALLDAGLTSLEISVHSFDPQRADRISRKRGTAAKQARALALLKALHDEGKRAPGVAINFVLFAANYGELPEFARTVARDYSFVDEFFINFLDPIGYPAHDHSLLPTYTEVAPALQEALDVTHAAGIPFTVDSVPGCVLGRYFLFLRATREKLRGVRYAKQTLRIKEAAPDPDLSQYYRVNACQECPVSGLCPGVNFRYLQIRGEGEFRPFPKALLADRSCLLPPEAPGSLLEDLARSASRPADSRPLQRLPITGQCNNRCRACSCRDRGRRALSPAALAKELTRIAADPDGPMVLLDGGEAPIHPGFFRMVRSLAAAGRAVGFVTNGRVFAYEKWVARVVAAGARRAIVRLPAPFGLMAEVSGDPEAEGQTRRGLEQLLRARRLAVHAEVDVTSGSAARVVATLAELAELGVYRITVRPRGEVATESVDRWRAEARRLAVVLQVDGG